MKTRKLLVLMGATVVLAQANPSYAEFRLGEWDLAATVSFGVQLTNGAEQQSAKFFEYRDLRDSVLSNASLSASKGDYEIDLNLSRIGLKDARYQLDGKKYGLMSYSLYHDSTIHNYTVGTSSYYSGLGTTALTYTPNNVQNPGALPDLWSNRLDYAKKIKTYGVDANYGGDSSIIFGLGYAHVNTDGTRPTGTSVSHDSSRVIEFAEPIDYKTNNYSAKVGYKGDDWLINFDGHVSKFNNENTLMNFRDPYARNIVHTEDYYLEPDNTYLKVGATGSYLKLPFDSALTWRASYSRLTNTVALPTVIKETNRATVGGGTPSEPTTSRETTLGVNVPEFNGKVLYGNANVAWSLNPVENLEAKVYYNFLRKWNQSSEVTYTNGANSSSNHLFSYYKHNPGFDLDYRLPFATKVGAGFEYLNVHRTREDAEKNNDRIVFAEVKNDYLDFLSAKLKYQYLFRTSVFNHNLGANDRTTFLRMFDATNKTQDTLKAGVDVMPIEHLDIGVEWAYSKSKYHEQNAYWGRWKDTSNDLYGSVSYEFPKLFKVGAFGNVERRTLHMTRVLGGAPFDPANNPGSAANHTNNWDQDLRFYGYGLNVDVPVMADLDFAASWEQYKSDGLVNVSGTAIKTSGGPYDNITNLDDYLDTFVKAKAQYRVTENLSAIVGYEFSRGTYSDISWDNYQFVPTTGATNVVQAYYTGQYADKDYEGHLGYLAAEYRF